MSSTRVNWPVHLRRGFSLRAYCGRRVHLVKSTEKIGEVTCEECLRRYREEVS